ncbi:MAG: hypothetical protein DRO11_08755 [Methanobacteriota archaeon]|nr:MAG: hypothetical protein DRO11_08755 [Euryarchaeota archaeon]
MPFDILAWSEAAPGTGTVGIAAPTTEGYKVSGDGIKIQSKANLLLGLWYAAESTPGYALLEQPSLGVQYPRFLRSCDLNDPDFYAGFNDLLDRPLPLYPNEFLVAKSNNATDEDTLIGVIVANGFWNPYRGKIDYRIRGYADQTLTANAWTDVSMSWDYNLPDGRYAIVGMTYGAYIASGFMQGFARVKLTETMWRPGVPIIQAEGDKVQVMSSMGVAPYHKWALSREISFKSEAMPDFEVISPAQLTDHVVELELVKIG